MYIGKTPNNTFLFYFLFFVLFANNICVAQVTSVSGRVVDAETNEALPFANIFFKGIVGGTFSDIDGNFKLQTEKAVDSLGISFMGYSTRYYPLLSGSTQDLKVNLSAESSGMDEVVVLSKKDDPAYEIVRQILKNKSTNHKKQLESYQYENYSKITIGIKNVDDQFRKKKILKPFKFVFNNIDSTEETPYLPIFFTESLSDVYYGKSNNNKTVVRAIKSSGIKNNGILNLMNSFSNSVYVYDDFINLFGKSFISPISNSCFAHYKFELLDSAFREGQWSYKIEYKPRRKQELTFAGEFWVADTAFAITDINGILPKEANINFVTSMKFLQRYRMETNASMVWTDQMIVHGEVFVPHEGKAQKFFCKMSSTNKDIKTNLLIESDFFKGESKSYSDSAAHYKEYFWNIKRHDSLTKNEKAIYGLIDSLRKVPMFRNYVALFTGYKSFKYLDVGPHFKVYNYNPVEGSRIRMGFRTNPGLSRNILVDGYAAYGFRDEEFKYGIGGKYFFSKNPRMLVGLNFKHDVEQLGWTQNMFRMDDNFLYTIFKINPNNKLNRVNEARVFIEKEWIKGFSNTVTFRRNIARPAGNLTYNYTLDNVGFKLPSITTAEISLATHFGYKEEFLYGDYNRVSLSSRYPIFDAIYTNGFKHFKSDYSYQKLVLAVRQRLRLRSLGYVKLRSEVGKIWGRVPFPLLEMHNGNPTLFFDEISFNTMNFFEFVSDEYASGHVSYHMDGFLFNKVPLFRKLKWREVITGKVVAGHLKDYNQNIFILPENMYALNKPFYEAGVGIENILRFIRVDAVWRLSYLDNPDIRRFIVKGSVHFNF